MRGCFALAVVVLIVAMATEVSAQDRVGVFFDADARTTEYQVPGNGPAHVSFYVIASGTTQPLGGYQLCLTFPFPNPPGMTYVWWNMDFQGHCPNQFEMECAFVVCPSLVFPPSDSIVLAVVEIVFLDERRPGFQVCPVPDQYYGEFQYFHRAEEGWVTTELIPIDGGGCATINPQSIPVESQTFGAIKALY